jgi:two-component system OmpR family sensor kinase
MQSLERYLLAWILGALTLGSVPIALVAYVVTRDEMNEVFDAELKYVAQAVGTYRHVRPDTTEAQGQSSTPTESPDGTEIVTFAWTATGQRIYASDATVLLPFSAVEGLSRHRLGQEDWTVYTSVRPEGVAQAAQRSSARQEMAGESAAKILPPLLVLILVTGALLVYALRQGLRPLDSAARDVAMRSATSLEPISATALPREVAPLVAAINDLMARIGVAFTRQRAFLADAAHELRTPVTALDLQLQLLKRSGDEASRREAIQELEAGIARSRRLIEQLLQLARSDPEGEALKNAPVDLGELVRAVIGTLSVKADRYGIDLGARVAPDVVVEGDVEQLTVLLNNLVENALRFAPRGGVVDVIVESREGASVLRVVDTGPGIPETERELVFQRFYRGQQAPSTSADTSGTGLGLAIVRAIAERHGARVSLHTAAGGAGTEVRIAFAINQPARPRHG